MEFYDTDVGENYGDPALLEIESSTLPLERINLPKLPPAKLPTSAGLHEVSLHHPNGTMRRQESPHITEIDQYYRNRIAQGYRIMERMTK